MGLIVKKIQSGYGQDFKDLYFKLDKIEYFPKNKNMSYAGFFYLSKEHADGGFERIPGVGIYDYCDCEDKTTDLYAHVYNHIKKIAAETPATEDYVQYGEHHPNYYPNYNIFKDAIDY